jgi:hypothetical protein
MKTVARAWDATLNDVALCILDAGINRYLKDLGQAPDHPLVALCPVSLRETEAREATTMVSAIWPPLGPVSAPIERRLQAIMANTAKAKSELRGLGKEAGYAFAVTAFAMSETLAIAQPEVLGLRPANVLISNVRGPEQALYLNGARLEALFPVSTLIVAIGLNVTLLSYANQVIMGFTANGSALPDIENLAHHTLEAFAELEQATARRKVRSRGKKPRAAARA